MKMENKNLNMPNVTVGEVVNLLAGLYSSAVKNRSALRGLPTPFLGGPAGIGKSEAIGQLAQRREAETGKKAAVTDVRLLLFSPVDLRGVPVADEHKRFSNWLMPKIFDMNPAEDHVNLLFLDELSAAPQSVQAAAYQICLDRKIGEHKLPENCIVIAAGNRTTDQSVSFKMPKALCNRLMHFNVETNYAAWLEWAIAHDVDSRIIGYLAFDNSKLCVEPESADMAYPTPRSWAFVSNLIRHSVGDLNAIHPLICACVGTDTAIEFEAWAGSHMQMPKVEDVLQGRSPKYPATHDALVAFTASLVAAIRANSAQITAHELENVCAYVKRFPTDFAMMFYTDLNAMEEIRLKLMKCPSCQSWLKKNRAHL
ncbi:MAG: AAA family ATPase [Clostridia bacterium]|nr:AAA family ATPase [Clostridia bacterium]